MYIPLAYPYSKLFAYVENVAVMMTVIICLTLDLPVLDDPCLKARPFVHAVAHSEYSVVDGISAANVLKVDTCVI